MNYHRRSSLEIFFVILRGVRQSINKTRLITKTNLSYRSFIKHSDFLENRGFIMKIPPPLPQSRKKNGKVKYHYVLTNKGIKLLDQISQEPLSELFDIMEEM